MHSIIYLCTLVIILSSYLVQALPVKNRHSTGLKPRYYYSYKHTWSSNWGDSDGNDGPSYHPKKSQPKKQGSKYSRPNTSKNNGDSGSYGKGKLIFRFNNGQCTDWADARYAQLTGYHVEWSGDARVWANKARNTPGWSVSTKPVHPSIIVIQPGVQGTGGAGHVATVESIKSNGDVYTSNWNYNGGPYIKTYTTFKSGYGVNYIWHN